jgi:hypothetical protein
VPDIKKKLSSSNHSLSLVKWQKVKTLHYRTAGEKSHKAAKSHTKSVKTTACHQLPVWLLYLTGQVKLQAKKKQTNVICCGHKKSSSKNSDF